MYGNCFLGCYPGMNGVYKLIYWTVITLLQRKAIRCKTNATKRNSPLGIERSFALSFFFHDAFLKQGIEDSDDFVFGKPRSVF